MFVYSSTTCVMWRNVIDQPQDLANMYKADINKLNSLLNSVKWDEALTDIHINSTFPASSIAF